MITRMTAIEVRDLVNKRLEDRQYSITEVQLQQLQARKAPQALQDALLRLESALREVYVLEKRYALGALGLTPVTLDSQQRLSHTAH